MIKEKFNRIFKKYFLTGVVVILPLYVTIFVLQVVLNLTDRTLKILPPVINPQTYINLPGVGLVITLILIIIVGAIASNYFGKKIVTFAEGQLSRIPVVRTIYQAVQQLMAGVLSDKETIFSRVVMVEFPRKGLYFIGFVTGDTTISEKSDKKFLKIFIPTTPNPTSGFFCMVAEDEVKYLDISVDDAFKLIISAGFAGRKAFL